jgi:hypothetical protein
MSPPQKHYEGLSDEELEAANQTLQAERSKIGEEQDRIAKIRDERSAKARAAQVLEGMSAGERDVLIEAASAQAKLEAKAPGGDGS